MGYKGGKGQSGVPQTIINLMPKHHRYFEGCLGSGKILEIKRPASSNYGIDVDRSCIQNFRAIVPNLKLLNVDVLAFLKCFPFQPGDLIYLDPPYLFSTRRYQKPIYKYEWTESQHLELVTMIPQIPAAVMISGYKSEMYSEHLATWRTASFNCVDHRGNVHREIVWMNFREPLQLHDYRFLGKNYRERYAIKLQIKTQKGRLARMSVQQRYAMLGAVEDFISRSGNADSTDRSGAGFYELLENR